MGISISTPGAKVLIALVDTSQVPYAKARSSLSFESKCALVLVEGKSPRIIDPILD
jgi:hypothetical protein